MASARAARSVQPSLARVGAAAAGVEPARRDTERRAMRPRRRRVPRVDPDPFHHLRVEGPLVAVRGDEHRLGQPLGQPQRHLAAPVSHHHLPGPDPQLVQVAGAGGVVTGSGEAGAELGRGAEQPGSHQRDHLVQVLQPVLHRSGGQQQQEPRGERPDQLPGRAVRGPQPVCLVRDHQIPPAAGELALQRVPARRGQRDQQHRPAAAAVRDPASSGDDGRRQAELALQLVAPLLDQAGRGEHERAFGQAPQPQLGQDQAGFDGLAQPDLVGQDRPAAHAAQHRGCRFALIVERLERQLRQGQERVETGPAQHRNRLIHQGGCCRVDRRAGGQPGQQPGQGSRQDRLIENRRGVGQPWQEVSGHRSSQRSRTPASTGLYWCRPRARRRPPLGRPLRPATEPVVALRQPSSPSPCRLQHCLYLRPDPHQQAAVRAGGQASMAVVTLRRSGWASRSSF